MAGASVLDVAVDPLKASREFCESMPESEDLVTCELLTRLADKWWLWVLDVLAQARGPVRFSQLRRGVEGVSQKSLTKTLRQLERDGLVTRQMYLEVPPRVEYAITPIGIELLRQVQPLWVWVATNAGRFVEARARFDGEKRKGAQSAAANAV